MTRTLIWWSSIYASTNAKHLVLALTSKNACLWFFLELFSNYWSQKHIGHYQHVDTKNARGYPSLQWYDSILLVFHMKLCIYHGPHHKTSLKNWNLWMDFRVSKCMGNHQVKVNWRLDTHCSLLRFGISCSYGCIQFGSWCHVGTKPDGQMQSTDCLCILTSK